MTDSGPLKLKLEPGSYSCMWEFPTKAGSVAPLPGKLDLEAGKPPSGSAHGEMPDFWTKGNGVKSADFPQIRTFPALRAHLANGMQALLTEAQTRIGFSNQATLHARAAFIGLEAIEQDDPKFEVLRVQITGLDRIAGIEPLKRNSFEFPRTGITGTWSADGEPASYQEWADEQAQMSLHFVGSWSGPDYYALNLVFSPVVEVTLKEPATLDAWRDQWIEPLRRVVSLATRWRENITYLSLGWQGTDDHVEIHDFQIYGSLIDQAPFVSKSDFTTLTPAVFTVRQDELSLLALVRAWQRLASDRHPLLETYGSSMVIPEQHPRARFLLLIQALEGLHGHETQAEYQVRTERHLVSRDKIIDIANTCESFDAADLAFLKGRLSKKPPRSLDAALKTLFTSLPGDVNQELEQTALIRSMRGSPKPPRDAVDALRVVRNDLAHGNRGYDAEELDEVARIVERATRAHLLRVLGYDNEVQARALDPTWELN